MNTHVTRRTFSQGWAPLPQPPHFPPSPRTTDEWPPLRLHRHDLGRRRSARQSTTSRRSAFPASSFAPTRSQSSSRPSSRTCSPSISSPSSHSPAAMSPSTQPEADADREARRQRAIRQGFSGGLYLQVLDQLKVLPAHASRRTSANGWASCSPRLASAPPTSASRSAITIT